MRQIDKEAAIWERKEIFTEQQAEQHIAYLESLRELSHKIYRLFGAVGRTPSETERKYVESWIDLGFEFAIIEKAYDKTVLAISKANFSYCDKILKTWHENNCKTLSEIKEYEEKNKNSAVAQKKSSSPAPVLSKPGAEEQAAILQLKRQREERMKKNAQ